MTQPGAEPQHANDEDSAVYRMPAGTFDAKIMQHLEHHVDDERKLIGEYESLREHSDHPPVRYLLGLLIEDEHRHHRILVEMLNQIRTSAYVVEHRPHVPWMTRRRDPGTAAAIKGLQQAERRDLRELRALRRRLKFLRRHSLDGVLVDALLLDTRKHLRYLRTIGHLV